MAAPLPPQLPKEALSKFTGVNLRVDPLAMADGELVRAVNADLHTQLGVLRLRQGRVRLSNTQLGSPSPVSALFRHLGRRYQVSGQNMYRNFLPLIGFLEGLSRPTVIPYQPLNDETTWSFIADRSFMRKDDGVTLAPWGIVASPTVPALTVETTGTLNGLYGAVYTYVRMVGASIAHESNPSPSPVPVSLASKGLGVPVQASLDPQVNGIRIYRTVSGGSIYLFDQQVPNVTAGHLSNKPDDQLGTQVETDNDPPPLAACAVEFAGHLWLCNAVEHPDYLYYSKRFRPESWPPDNFLKIGDPSDPLLSMVALTGVIGVFTSLTKYRVFGSTASGFTALEALNSRGVASPNATTATAKGVAFVAKDGIWLTNFVEADVELSQGIQGLFAGQTIGTYNPIDLQTVTNLAALAEHKRRLYFGYRDTQGQFVTAIYNQDTQHWYHANHDSHVFLYEEDNDFLTVGTTAGFVEIVDREYTDIGVPITLDVVMAPRGGGDPFARKGYGWLGIDSEGADPWNVSVLVDGVLVLGTQITGARRKRYVRLPPHTVGHTWQVAVSYLGTSAAALYEVEMLYTQPAQGQVWVEEAGNPDVFVQILPGAAGPSPLLKRRFVFFTMDADPGAAGPWQADIFVDEVLRSSLTIPDGAVNRLHVLPEGLAGYEWFTRMRYVGGDTPLLHTVNVAEAPHTQGQVWVEEPGAPGRLLQFLPGSALQEPVMQQRMTFLALDAHAAAPGTWTVDVVVDGMLRTTLTIPHTGLSTLYPLPEGLRGYEWRTNVRYTGAATPFVHAVNLIDTGASDGQIWIAGAGGGYQSILPATEAASPFVKRRYLYLKTDLEQGPGVWTLDFFVDDILRQTVTVGGQQAHDLIRLRPGLLGSRWRLAVRYSEAQSPTFFGVKVVSQELQVA